MVNSSKITALVNAMDARFQSVANIVTSWGIIPSNNKYPSEKLVKDSLDTKSDSTHIHGGISNDGKIGTDSGKVIVTTTNGTLTASDWVAEVDSITQALIDYGENL